MTGLRGEDDPQRIVQEVWFPLYEQMVYAQSGIRPRKWDAQNLLGFWDKNGSSNLGQTTRPSDSQQIRELAE